MCNICMKANCMFHSNKAPRSSKNKPKFVGGDEALKLFIHDVQLLSGLTAPAYGVGAQMLLCDKWAKSEPAVVAWCSAPRIIGTLMHTTCANALTFACA